MDWHGTIIFSSLLTTCYIENYAKNCTYSCDLAFFKYKICRKMLCSSYDTIAWNQNNQFFSSSSFLFFFFFFSKNYHLLHNNVSTINFVTTILHNKLSDEKKIVSLCYNNELLTTLYQIEQLWQSMCEVWSIVYSINMRSIEVQICYGWTQIYWTSYGHICSVNCKYCSLVELE